MSKWISVCQLNDINPKTGVCALVKGKQVAIFRPRDNDELFAIDNMDPFAKSNVLSRGLICEHDDQLWVASPLKKQRFNLATGQCLENDLVSLTSYKVRVNKDSVEINI
ncbi:nitrite reductase small subunit NirD [Moritella viscosa]|uniref:Nitrite reductase (NADH) small subunit n=1 Tax=Moritella viscosa TaxID=80854 RepID=A0A1L0BZD7_9GAMM|nr:nitrite reductase small subunit NirD [Moritella viscosa]SGZ11810.1 Putative nitrite reductase (NAD(P)H) smallsubunit [Moritella viscosa]SHO12513.1 Putative nitrite reductase (NAD(P)H) smallsubunit [Moritella viscosa]SHO12518.1 Putative nitrite reductase (NAD(P)H) smallsubunit [Moritella viscosa]SHO16622.1 Putative nitrite reductase (NAD(P)H) smallsubunit [Moritella viscosa]SHO18403.1 Putative nitrite reductase (NAD(P)H) smallsubunit [Moritella viscosa]